MKTNCQVCAKLGHVQSSSIAVKMEASASVLIGCVMELPTVWTNQMNKIVQVTVAILIREKMEHSNHRIILIITPPSHPVNGSSLPLLEQESIYNLKILT